MFISINNLFPISGFEIYFLQFIKIYKLQNLNWLKGETSLDGSKNQFFFFYCINR